MIRLSRPIKFLIHISCTGGDRQLPSHVAATFFMLTRASAHFFFLCCLFLPLLRVWRSFFPHARPQQSSCSVHRWFPVLSQLRLQVLKQQRPVLKLQQPLVHPQPTEFVLCCLLCLSLHLPIHDGVDIHLHYIYTWVIIHLGTWTIL
jgi:hypothetical protein